MLALPLMNIRQSDMLLRSDNLHLLRQTGLSADLLLFRDQLDLRALHQAGHLRLTLVDHNVLPRYSQTPARFPYVPTHTCQVYTRAGVGNLYHSKSHLDPFHTVKKTLGATKPF